MLAFLLTRVLFSNVFIYLFFILLTTLIACPAPIYTSCQLKVLHLKHLKLQPIAKALRLLNIRLLSSEFIVPESLRNTLIRKKATDVMHCVVCSSSIYPFWYLQTLLIYRYTDIPLLHFDRIDMMIVINYIKFNQKLEKHVPTVKKKPGSLS